MGEGAIGRGGEEVVTRPARYRTLAPMQCPLEFAANRLNKLVSEEEEEEIRFASPISSGGC